MRPRAATAFAPGAITNFFRIHYDLSGRSPIGATGGGYVLSRGCTTKVTLFPGRAGLVTTVVNGEAAYDARTSRRAILLFLKSRDVKFGELMLKQEVGTPIGAGFGASAASAISGVLAAAAVLKLRIKKPTLTQFANEAEVIEQTGLGTVSVTYDAVGAGAITRPGSPGQAKFLNVKVPRGTRIVTAYLAPFDKKDALSSKNIGQKINRLGDDALSALMAEPTLEVLAEQGEIFSRRLGLESREVKKLEAVAKQAGAMYASQNMIGYAVHAIADEDSSSRVARALRASGLKPRVDVFRVGAEKAQVRRG